MRRREDHARRIAITFTRERRHTGNALEPPLLDEEDEDDAAYPIAVSYTHLTLPTKA